MRKPDRYSSRRVISSTTIEIAALIVFAAVVLFGRPVMRIYAERTGGRTTRAAGQSATPSPVPAVWVSSPLVRVGPTDAPGATTSINLSGARGETLDTQVIVTAPGANLTNVNLTASALTGPGGATIAAANLVFYREYYVTVAGSTPVGGNNPPLGSGTYPDPLIPFVDPETGAPLKGAIQAVPASVIANQNQPFWIDLNIPRGATNAPPGTYTGAVTVTSDQGTATLPVTLTLWNFELPLTPSEKSLFLIWNDRTNTANQQSLLRNKIMPAVTSSFRAQSQAANFGLNRAGLDNAFYIGIQCDGTIGGGIPTPAQIQSLAARFPAGLPLNFYASDENNGCTASYPPIQQLANNAHPYGVKILDTIPPVSDLYGYVDYWVMLPGDFPPSFAGIPGEFWSFASCNVGNGSYPGWLMDYPPINERMNAGFLNQTQGASGLLHWRVDQWTAGDSVASYDNPFPTGCGVSRPGDGELVYPPQTISSTEPAPGIRLKALRDGVQDYEYVQMLKNLGQGAFASSVVNPIATNWSTWSHDPNDLERVRLQLGQQLNQLSTQP